MSKLPKDLPQRLRAAGLKVVTIGGWYSRGRPGSFAPKGVLWHHTGSTLQGKAMATWLARTGRKDLAAPLAQISISKAGTVYILAAGRANHAGWARKGGPLKKRTDGNKVFVGIEFQSDGSGFSLPQYEAGLAVTAILLQQMKSGAAWCRSHKETSETGKWDPGKVDMSEVRAELASRLTPVKEPSKNKPHPRGRIRVDFLLKQYKAGLRNKYAKKGSNQNKAVRQLQGALGVLADGKYGPGTRSAVATFQRREGLTADGIAGKITVTALGFLPA